MESSLWHKIQILATALSHPRCPRSARFVIVLTLAMALSPVDLVPDFIPILGYLDDLLLIPLGLSLAYRLLPDEVIKEAEQSLAEQPVRDVLWYKRLGVGISILVWILLIILGVCLWRHFFPSRHPGSST